MCLKVQVHQKKCEYGKTVHLFQIHYIQGFKVLFVTYSIIQNIISSEM